MLPLPEQYIFLRALPCLCGEPDPRIPFSPAIQNSSLTDVLILEKMLLTSVVS